MFCGWGHPKTCHCTVCNQTYRLSRKAAYRLALASAKAQMKERSNDLLRKPLPGESYGPPSVPFNDKEFRTKFPNIYEYLTTQNWADGSVRATSTITIFSDGTSLKIVLNDRDNNRSAFFSEETFDDTMACMEASLAADRVDWKSRSGQQARGMQVPF